MKKFIVSAILLAVSTNIFAVSVINTHTDSWKSIPITVNNDKHTYNLDKAYLIPEGDYYYSYSGYRCLKDKLDNAGAEPVVYNDDNSPKDSIYCYPEQ